MRNDKNHPMNDPVKDPRTRQYIDLDEIETEMDNPDLDLVTDYLLNELNPAQVEEVKRRLEEDPEFREFAAPLIALWEAGRVPPPVPREQLEAAWDRFTKRAGFTHQRRKQRKRILFVSLTTFVLALVVTLVAFRKQILTAIAPPQPAAADTAQYRVITDSDHDVTLMNGLRVRLERGATLRVPRPDRPSRVQLLSLEGAARFVAPRPDPNVASDALNMWHIRTRGATTTAIGAATFRLTSRGDTTTVAVEGSLTPGPYTVMPRGPVMPDPTVSGSVVFGADPSPPRQRHLIVQPGETARLVVGSYPMRIVP